MLSLNLMQHIPDEYVHFHCLVYLDISHTSPRAMRPAVNQSRITTFPFEDSSTSWKENFTGSQETMLTIELE